jgi:hypothetical protein
MHRTIKRRFRRKNSYGTSHSPIVLPIFVRNIERIHLCQRFSLLLLTDAFVNRWYAENFRNPNRPKPLILSGGTGKGTMMTQRFTTCISRDRSISGKTSFALSLPGHVRHFSGHWNIDNWSDGARYIVFDDIPWDSFAERGYPDKKDLLTGNGWTSVR